MSFRDIRDQAVPVRLLRNMLRGNRIPNGLLFWGPGGVGKGMTAMEMAKAINCAHGEFDACDACLSCRKVKSGNHPGLTLIAPVKKSRIIGVEAVQSMNEMASLRTVESKWRVFIIQEADRMGIPAQSKFLKTLEEPPGNSLFILLTEFPGMLLPTIRSRCQRIRFGPLRPETIVELLRRGRDLPEDVAQSIAALAQGQMSRAIDLVDSDKREIALDITRRLAEGHDPVALAEEFAGHLDNRRQHIESEHKADLNDTDLNDVSQEDRDQIREQQKALAEAHIRRDIMEYLYLLETWYRDVTVYCVTRDPARVLNHDQQARLDGAPISDMDRKITAIDKARLYLERNLKEERVFRDLFFALAE